VEIGEEEDQPVEYPIPVDPAKRRAPRREEVPVEAPVETPVGVPEPAHTCWCRVNHPTGFVHKVGAAMAYAEARHG